jgi:hypothetical protein
LNSSNRQWSEEELAILVRMRLNNETWSKIFVRITYSLPTFIVIANIAVRQARLHWRSKSAVQQAWWKESKRLEQERLRRKELD